MFQLTAGSDFFHRLQHSWTIGYGHYPNGEKCGCLHDVGSLGRYSLAAGSPQPWARCGGPRPRSSWRSTPASSGGRAQDHVRRGNPDREYDLLLTRRLTLQPWLETSAAVQEVKAHGVGSGFNDVVLDLRLRYEIRRQFAPYVGLSWNWKLGRTGDLSEDDRVTAVVAGVRWWLWPGVSGHRGPRRVSSTGACNAGLDRQTSIDSPSRRPGGRGRGATPCTRRRAWPSSAPGARDSRR